MTVNRNLEEELLRVKSLVSAKRKDPAFYTGSNESNENRESIQGREAVLRTQQHIGPSNANRAEGSLKRSADGAENMVSSEARCSILIW